MNLPAREAKAAPLAVRAVAGVPDSLDRLADTLDPDHAFLRAAWFRAAGADSTLLAEAAGGSLLAAFPTIAAGPPALGARAVVGAYWPFRTVPISPKLSGDDLVALLADPRAKAALGPLWRMGPFYEDDPAGARLIDAAARAGWTMLTRSLGHSYMLEIAEQRATGPWPRPSTLKRIRNYERQLGEVSLERVSGGDWSPAIFDALREVEAASWIASRTDGSGAKFLNAASRAFWETAAADPVLAEMMSALILRVGGKPVAFCFDLNVGTLQYSIAGSYDAAFAKLKPGKIATYRNIEWALERGIMRIDWGAGDGGYKREIGAVQGPQIVDCLFVRNGFVASILRPRWKRPVSGGGDDARKLPLRRRDLLLIASLITAATAGALAE
ncbi:MAG TPA: GNAT family N-acetyltransferase [Allosphingosinicella sp.]